MKLNRLYSFERLLIIVIFITLTVTYYRYYQLKQETMVQAPNTGENFNQAQLFASLEFTDAMTGQNFPSSIFLNVTKDKPALQEFEQPTIVFIFSLSGCDLCINTQIEFLNEMWKHKDAYEPFGIVGIIVDQDAHLPGIRRYKKIMKIEYDIFTDFSQTITKWLPPETQLPLILVIRPDRKITRAHLPIIGDSWLVERFYRLISVAFSKSNGI